MSYACRLKESVSKGRHDKILDLFSFNLSCLRREQSMIGTLDVDVRSSLEQISDEWSVSGRNRDNRD